MSVLSISQQALNRKSVYQSSLVTNLTSDEIHLKSIDVIPEYTKPKTSIENALGVLFSYIPTEVIALYVAVISAIKVNSSYAGWVTFFIFLIFTPLVVWLVYAAKVKKATGVIPLTISSIPVWEMTASTLAFIAWAFALPDSIFQTFTWYSQSVAGVSILLTSTILSLISPFFEKN